MSINAKTEHSTNPKDVLGRNKPPLNLIPPVALVETAMAFKLGATKYGPFNWREHTVAASVYTGAILRHLACYQDGENTDIESGVSHLAHVIACAAIILDAASIGKLVDDRPRKGVAPEAIAFYTGQSNARLPQAVPPASDGCIVEADEILAIFEDRRAAEDMKFLVEAGCLTEVAERIARSIKYSEYKNEAGIPHDYVYIAGPMRGLPEFNFPAFDAQRDAWLAGGWNVISPADIDRNSEPGVPIPAEAEARQREYTYRDFYALWLVANRTTHGGIAMLRNWETSTGAAAELFLARWLKLRIYRHFGGGQLDIEDVKISELVGALAAYIHSR